jgi:hypothetical protein
VFKDCSGKRSTARVRKPVQQFTFDVMLSEILDWTTDSEGAEFEDPISAAPGEIFSVKAMFGDESDVPDNPLLAFAMLNDPDTLYLHEAQLELDFGKLVVAMEKEIIGQWDIGNFRLRKHSNLKKGTSILPGVWALKRKCWILSGEVHKHKARWNLDGPAASKCLAEIMMSLISFI